MTETVVYEGNDPDASQATANKFLGKPYDGVTIFTGQANWSDYESSIGWASYESWGFAKDRFWSIPLFANGGTLAQAGVGAYNAEYTQAAQTLATSQQDAVQPIYVRTGWEFNGNWEVWNAQSDPANYVKAWVQFVTQFRAVSNRFVFTWCPALLSQGMADPSAAYPGDAYVDIMGADVYDTQQYQGPDPAATFANFKDASFGLDWLVSFAKAHGKPICIPEWGVDADVNAAFVTEFAAYLLACPVPVIYQSYWDSDNAVGDQISTGALPAVAAAYQAAFGPQATVTPPAPITPATPTPTPEDDMSPTLVAALLRCLTPGVLKAIAAAGPTPATPPVIGNTITMDADGSDSGFMVLVIPGTTADVFLVFGSASKTGKCTLNAAFPTPRLWRGVDLASGSPTWSGTDENCHMANPPGPGLSVMMAAAS